MPATSMLSFVQKALRNSSSSATTRSSPRAAAPGPTASRSRHRPPRRSPAAPANVPSSAIQVTVYLPLCQAAPNPLGRRMPTGRAANVALDTSQPPRHPTRHWPSRLDTIR